MMSSLSRQIMPRLAPLLSDAKHVIFATGTALSGFPLGLLRQPFPVKRKEAGAGERREENP
jgi:hypothetical protein